MRFEEIPEQEVLKGTLLKMVAQNKVAHAQLFVGATGSANLALALAFASYLNCSARTKNDACGCCFSCSNMAQFTHPDFQLLFPKKSSSAESRKEVKEIRTFQSSLKKNPFLTLEEWSCAMECNHCQMAKKDADELIQRLSLKAFLGKYKIVCIWLPEYFTRSAANALLKTLEEPPMQTVFLLVSCNSEKILPAIRSRSQQHYVPPFSERAIEELLHTKYEELAHKQCKAIAFLAEGNPYKAFQLVEKTSIDHFTSFSNWMRSCYSGNFIKLIEQAEAFHTLSRDMQESFLAYALQLIRVTLLHKFHSTLSYTMLPEESTFSINFGLNTTVAQLKTLIELITKAYGYIEQYANAKMVYASLSIQIAKLFKSLL